MSCRRRGEGSRRGRTLDHSPPRLLLVLEPRLAADADDLRVVGRRSDEAVERVGCDRRVGVDDEHELRSGRESQSRRTDEEKARAATHLVQLRVDADDVLDLVVHLELEREHLRVEVDAVQPAHGEDLRVALAAVAGARALGRAADLGDDDVGDDVCREGGHRVSEAHEGEEEGLG